jgi:hypothetical protein
MLVRLYLMERNPSPQRAHQFLDDYYHPITDIDESWFARSSCVLAFTERVGLESVGLNAFLLRKNINKPFFSLDLAK